MKRQASSSFLNIKLNVESCRILFPFRCHVWETCFKPLMIATPRLYFHIGPRCWSIATTIAVGATVLGRDSHPGYKLLASAVPWQNSRHEAGGQLVIQGFEVSFLSMVHLGGPLQKEIPNLETHQFHVPSR